MDRRLARLPPVERWPTAEEASAARWFSPLQLGPVRAETRTWVPAMVPWRASEEGGVTPEVLAWYQRFARGQPGVLVLEATGIRDVPSGPLLRIGSDAYLDGLRRVVEAVRAASDGKTRLFIQLIDFLAMRRRPAKEAYFGRFWKVDAASRGRLAALVGDDALLEADEAAVRARALALDEAAVEQLLSARELESYRFGFRERVTDLEVPHLRELPRTLPALFAAAAQRAEAAGFDGVELHYAHAYTMASFLSARNTRSDGYGLTREGRVRLPLEVFQAVRAAVSPALAVGCRMLCDEVIEGGSTVDDAAYFATAFARAGMDFISLSRGGKFEDAKQPKVGEAAYPYTGVSGHECMPTTRLPPPGPFGRSLPLMGQVKAALVRAGLSTPVVVCGGISTFEQAEQALASGVGDAVASARQSLADPDWFLKLRLGRGAEIRRCFFTNYCEGLDQKHQAVTCQRWDRLRSEDGELPVARTVDGRRWVAPDWSAGEAAVVEG